MGKKREEGGVSKKLGNTFQEDWYATLCCDRSQNLRRRKSRPLKSTRNESRKPSSSVRMGLKKVWEKRERTNSVALTRERRARKFGHSHQGTKKAGYKLKGNVKRRNISLAGEYFLVGGKGDRKRGKG